MKYKFSLLYHTPFVGSLKVRSTIPSMMSAGTSYNMTRRFWSWPENRFVADERPAHAEHSQHFSSFPLIVFLSRSLMGWSREENRSNLLPQSAENYINVPTADGRARVMMMRRHKQGVVSHPLPPISSPAPQLHPCFKHRLFIYRHIDRQTLLSGKFVSWYSLETCITLKDMTCVPCNTYL